MDSRISRVVIRSGGRMRNFESNASGVFTLEFTLMIVRRQAGRGVEIS